MKSNRNAYSEQKWSDKEPTGSPVYPKPPAFLPNHHLDVLNESVSSVNVAHTEQFHDRHKQESPTGGVTVN